MSRALIFAISKSRTCYQQPLQAWLRELASRWATSTLLHRARIIDRFLDHLLATGAIDHNPVEALREACHIKQRMPIWRAISCNPEQALARLRQPKPFGSVLGEVTAEHIAMMRRRGYKRGYKYTSQPVRLLQFDRFLHTQLAGHVSLDTTNHYAKANLETKRKALELIDVPTTAGHQPSWKRDTSLLARLDTL